MAYTKTNWENDVTELSAENFNHIEDGIYNSTNLELYGVYNEISEVPTNTPNGKLFYLSSTNKIYEVTNTGAYHEFAEPISGIFYIVPIEQKNYAYNGTTLVSVGGGGGSATGDTLPIGAIIPFGGINAPAGWLICDGQAVSRTTYSDLFSKIGTSYGAGDGSTTFNLPNLKGKVLVGQDTDQTEFNEIGKTGGEKTHTLTIDEIPSHNHSVGTWYGGSGSSDFKINAAAGDASPIGGDTSGNTGGNQAHNNLQPYTVSNYIIKASQTAGLVASVVNTRSTSDKDTYSCDYLNGTILYQGGTTGNVTLSDDASNYSIIKIFAEDADTSGSDLSTIDILGSQTKFSLSGVSVRSNSYTLFNSTYNISGKNINVENTNIYVSNTGNFSSYNVFKIVKVIGYK